MKIIRSNAVKALNSGGMLRMRGLGLWVIIAIFIMGLSGVASAAPSITDWSSSGGSPTNKDNSQDLMYLVQPGDEITFSVTANETCSYNWSVNKVDQGVNSNTFTFTVPSLNCSQDPSECIFEVHVKAYNENGEAHHEWVISTLNNSEAPDIFDYFADKKYAGDRNEKDPWNRIVSSWTFKSEVDASRGFLRSTEEGHNWWIYHNSTTTYGTWRFRYRYPDGNTGAWGGGAGVSGIWSYNKDADSHHHCCVPVGSSGHSFSIEYDGCGWGEEGGWHQVTVIRTPDTWLYMYYDGVLEFYVQDMLDTTANDFYMRLARYKGHEMHLDNVEVYNNKYLFPQVNVSYRNYIWNYYYVFNKGYYPETSRQGIVVEGRNVTLSEIADKLGDPSKFSYDPTTKTAICNSDLVLDWGAELVMNNETLIFNCSSDGQWHFVPKYSSHISLKNSTITTSGEHYFIWNNGGSTTHFGNVKGVFDLMSRVMPPRPMSLGNAGFIRLTMENSTINNAAHIFFDSPMGLNIINSKFTNLHEVDVGNYTGAKPERKSLEGDKSFWVDTDEVNVNNFNLRGITFSGKDSPINLTFLTNSYRDRLNIYDVNAENENIVVKNPPSQCSGQSHTCDSEGPPYDEDNYYHYATFIESEIGLVNCKFKDILIPAILKKDKDSRPVKKSALVKYYLDVKVVDEDNNPVSNATVTVANEVHPGYPAENMEVTKPWTDGEYTCFYHHRRILEGQPLNSTITGADGHTPLPIDEYHTLIVTDYQKKVEDVPDGVRIRLDTASYVRGLKFDAYDRLYGHLFHRYMTFPKLAGHPIHFKVTYNKENKTFSLQVVNKDTSEVIWDTGQISVPSLTNFNLSRVEFNGRHTGSSDDNISWNSSGYINFRNHGWIETGEWHIDNMRVNVSGIGLIENNDYSTDPGLIAKIEDENEYYNLSQSTNSNSFVWEFDGLESDSYNKGPVFEIWLRDNNDTEDSSVKTINFTYAITAQKDGKTASLSGLDIDDTWYREDPNTPTKTVVCNIDTGECWIEGVTTGTLTGRVT
ncbi:MAG: hypothetical protein DRO76_05755, partial [Candidatus Altiarchaeales archaeon]